MASGGVPWFQSLVRTVVRVYFPRVTVSHRERLPAYGPAVIVANHPNGLLDPVVLQIALRKPLRFLAKSTFWDNPVGAAVMNAVGALPAYRAREADTSKNEQTFAECRAILRSEGWLALFPEGTSHDEPDLLPLKTGAARIALSAAAETGWKTGVRIVPVGLLYEDKSVFRTGVGVVVGEPVSLDTFEAAYAADPRAAATALTDKLGEMLGEVVLRADGEELWRGIFAVATWTAPDGGADTAARDRRALALADRVRRLAAEDPERLDDAVAATRRFVRLMRVVGVRDPFAVEDVRPVRWMGGLLPLIVAAPIALLGAVFAWVPYRLVRPIAARVAAGDTAGLGTYKLIGGVLFLVPTYLAWAVAAGLAVHPLAGLAMLAIGPLTGLVALWFDRGVRLRREAFNGLLRSTDARVVKAIHDGRLELCRLVEDALREPSRP